VRKTEEPERAGGTYGVNGALARGNPDVRDETDVDKSIMLMLRMQKRGVDPQLHVTESLKPQAKDRKGW
jgi:hypothetical protein